MAEISLPRKALLALAALVVGLVVLKVVLSSRTLQGANQGAPTPQPSDTPAPWWEQRPTATPIPVALTVVSPRPSPTAMLNSGPTPTPLPWWITPEPTAVATGAAAREDDSASIRGRVYLVQAGDTLAAIAARHQVSLDELVAANAGRYPSLLEDSGIIEVGWQLVIPAGEPRVPSTPSPDEAEASTWRVPSPSYGLAAHLLGDDDTRQAALDRVQELGFDWVKVQIRWLDYEGRGKGVYTWDWLDPIVTGVNDRELKLLISVVAAPEWARPPGDDLGVHGTPEDPRDLGHFVAAMTGRYRGQIGAIEVWNEQNLGRETGYRLDVEHYVAMLQSGYQSVKAVDPQVIIVSGGLTPTGTDDGYVAIDDRRYLNQMLAAGAGDYADAIGAHPSGYNLPPDADWRQPPPEQCGAFQFPCTNPHPSWSFKATLEDTHRILVNHGVDKQVWATEFGWASCGVPQPGYEYCQDNTAWEHREYLRRALELVGEWGWDWVGVMFVWNLNYAQAAPGTEMAAFSILDGDGNPTDAFEGLKGLGR